MSDDRTRSMAPKVPNPTARLRLIVFCGGEVKSHPAPRHGELILGRGGDAGIPIEHVTVSRKHASLLFGDDIRIVDHGSFNGTRIGGKKLPPHTPTPLGIATIAELGDAMVVVQVEGAEAVTHSRSASSARVPRPELSEAMQHLYRLVDNVAESNLTVVVRGETGAGKEVIAEEIHKRSPRASGPLIKLNCAALPEQLLESELFGYERGAFTGANTAKPGLIEAANGGTLFLDEVGELPLATQAKLLRVVESREVMRLGSLRTKLVDIRLIAATHRDLEAMVASGAFRQDLYYRINLVALHIPPLRERTDEIPRLAKELAARFCRESKRPTVPISDAAMAILKSHPWPGNVRELRNVIERAIVFCKSVAIAPEHLGLGARSSSRPIATANAAVPPQDPALAATAFAATSFDPRGLGARPPSAPPANPYAPPPPTPTGPPPVIVTPTGPPPAGGALVDAGAATLFGASLPAEVDALERERILQALARCDGNQTQAAELLGISRRTLLRRLDEYQLPRPRKP